MHFPFLSPISNNLSPLLSSARILYQIEYRYSRLAWQNSIVTTYWKILKISAKKYNFFDFTNYHLFISKKNCWLATKKRLPLITSYVLYWSISQRCRNDLKLFDCKKIFVPLKLNAKLQDNVWMWVMIL